VTNIKEIKGLLRQPDRYFFKPDRYFFKLSGIGGSQMGGGVFTFSPQEYHVNPISVNILGLPI